MSIKFILIYVILLIFAVIGSMFIINSLFSKNCLTLQTEDLLRLIEEWENYKKRVESEKGETIFKIEGCVKEANFYRGEKCWEKDVDKRFGHCMCMKTVDNPFEERCIGIPIDKEINIYYKNPYLAGEYKVELYRDYFEIIK